MDVYLSGKRVRVAASMAIGKGGEADVYDIGGGSALKLFKGPEHPDLAGDAAAQASARARLDEQQRKLRAFPAQLPGRVVAPRELATDRQGARVLGYAMTLVGGAEVLLSFSDPARRRAGLGGARIAAVLSDLWATVRALHAAGVVIGDFNDLNVLVRGEEAHVIDADSFQLGGFPCRVYTERFVDPLLCDAAAPRPEPVRTHEVSSDWYAFAVMLMQSLLCVGPHGGVHRPRAAADRVPQAARPLRRITVFHPDVIYPRPALPLESLPDELLHELHRVFVLDHRAPFPRELLARLTWSRCGQCGLESARARCPVCDRAQGGVVQSVTIVRGALKATRIFATSGVILAAAAEGGALRWLYHEGGEYRREDGRVVLRGPLDPALDFWIQGETTFVGRGAEVATLAPCAPPARAAVDPIEGRPAFAASAGWTAAVRGGRLYRRRARAAAGGIAALIEGEEGAPIGDVLAGQTRIWIGERFGLGFYRAGELAVAFVFDAARSGLRDGVKLPGLRGRLVGQAVHFDEDRAWVHLAAERAGRVIHHVTLVRADGVVLASAEGEPGDGTWLGSLEARCAHAGALLCATPDGLTRVELQAGALVPTRRFPDAEPFVSGANRLLIGPRGVWAVEAQAIRELSLG